MNWAVLGAVCLQAVVIVYLVRRIKSQAEIIDKLSDMLWERKDPTQ